MMEEITREIIKTEERGAINIVIILNPFFANLYDIHGEYLGYTVHETSLVPDFKIIT